MTPDPPPALTEAMQLIDALLRGGDVTGALDVLATSPATQNLKPVFAALWAFGSAAARLQPDGTVLPPDEWALPIVLNARTGRQVNLSPEVLGADPHARGGLATARFLAAARRHDLDTAQTVFLAIANDPALLIFVHAVLTQASRALAAAHRHSSPARPAAGRDHPEPS